MSPPAQNCLNGPTEIQATYPGTGAGNSGGTMTFAPANYKERAALLLLNGDDLHEFRVALRHPALFRLGHGL